MNCAACQELLLELAYGELTPLRAAEVELHLASCTQECKAELEKIRGTRASFAPLFSPQTQGATESPSGDFDGPILAAARAAAEAAKNSQAKNAQVIPLAARARPRWMRTVVATSLAAAAALALVVANRHPGLPSQARVDPEAAGVTNTTQVAQFAPKGAPAESARGEDRDQRLEPKPASAVPPSDVAGTPVPLPSPSAAAPIQLAEPMLAPPAKKKAKSADRRVASAGADSEEDRLPDFGELGGLGSRGNAGSGGTASGYGQSSSSGMEKQAVREAPPPSIAAGPRHESAPPAEQRPVATLRNELDGDAAGAPAKDAAKTVAAESGEGEVAFKRERKFAPPPPPAPAATAQPADDAAPLRLHAELAKAPSAPAPTVSVSPPPPSAPRGQAVESPAPVALSAEASASPLVRPAPHVVATAAPPHSAKSAQAAGKERAEESEAADANAATALEATARAAVASQRLDTAARAYAQAARIRRSSAPDLAAYDFAQAAICRARLGDLATARALRAQIAAIEPVQSAPLKDADAAIEATVSRQRQMSDEPAPSAAPP